MVQIHGLRDLEQGPDPQQAQQGTGQQRVVTVGGGSGNSGPMPELHEMIAPKFKFASFVFVVTILELAVFLLELVVNFMEDGEFISKWNPGMGPSGSTLKLMRACNRELIRDGDYDRLVVPIFLHASVIHIFLNLLVTTIFCYRMEEAWGTLRTAFVYVFTGICGCLFSSGVGSSNSLSVGASGAILGMIGAMLIHLFMIWNSGTEVEKMTRQMQACNLGCISIMMVVLGLMSAISNDSGASNFNKDNTDHFGHIGGLLGGLLIALAIPARVENPMECLSGSMVPIIASISLLGVIGGCVCGIFL